MSDLVLRLPQRSRMTHHGSPRDGAGTEEAENPGMLIPAMAFAWCVISAQAEAETAARSDAAIAANAETLARYAALCQEQHLVPIVEPEVLMDGTHTIERCEEVTSAVLHAVFEALGDDPRSMDTRKPRTRPLRPSPACAGFSPGASINRAAPAHRAS